jgi:hypothetical protein
LLLENDLVKVATSRAAAEYDVQLAAERARIPREWSDRGAFTYAVASAGDETDAAAFEPKEEKRLSAAIAARVKEIKPAGNVSLD